MSNQPKVELVGFDEGGDTEEGNSAPDLTLEPRLRVNKRAITVSRALAIGVMQQG
jgi:hypothetical protein